MNAHGPVSPADHAYAHNKIMNLQRWVLGTALNAKVDLIVDEDQASERLVIALAELVVHGQTVQGHATATTVRGSIDLLATRLRGHLGRCAPFQEDTTTP